MTQSTLDDAIQELFSHVKKSEDKVVVALSGPNTFTVSVYCDDLVEQTIQEVPC
ncbi:hypothetical protein GA0061083_0051 [Pseudarthrobacter enclensis]|nr:hypothetical protein GA0061083_0051 [Pseudarthrobacter enclensis]